MPGWAPPLRISEVGGRVRLGLEGFGDVEGATLQEAADALVERLLVCSLSFRAGTMAPPSSECCPDPALLDFVYRFGEVAARGGDPRELLFGPNPLAA
jgi:hypothetical protein